jgi:hypothetical protein
MLGLYDHHAKAYYDAVKGEQDPPYHDLTENAKIWLRTTAKEILLSTPHGEMSVHGVDARGISAVLAGGQRSRVACPQPVRDGWIGRLGPGVKWESPMHVYDSLAFGGPVGLYASSWRLFGNANVGQLSHTNLQVGGQMMYGRCAYVEAMYVTVELFDQRDEKIVRDVLEEARICLVEGDRPHGYWSGWDLFTAPRPVGVFLPPRQNFSATVNTGAAASKLDELIRSRDDRRHHSLAYRPRLVVHFEGWQGEVQ